MRKKKGTMKDTEVPKEHKGLNVSLRILRLKVGTGNFKRRINKNFVTSVKSLCPLWSFFKREPQRYLKNTKV